MMLPREIITNVTGIQQGIINKATAKAPEVSLPSLSPVSPEKEKRRLSTVRAMDWSFTTSMDWPMCTVLGMLPRVPRTNSATSCTVNICSSSSKMAGNEFSSAACGYRRGLSTCHSPPAAQGSEGRTAGTLNAGSAQSFYRLCYGWCSWFGIPGAQSEQVTCSTEKSSAAAVVNLRMS